MNRDNYDKIFISDLCVDMYAGIYDFERQKSQRVIFNIEIEVLDNQDKTLKEIEEVLSYEDICNDVIYICKQRHYDLLEELAQEICSKCLSYSHARSITLKIEKPDIIKNTKSVGIITRRTAKC